ncbi:LuxR C-terminal-related transcriptional regulator [Schlesneria sp. DSM 10557]|uniref:LuxR C-terminal-related transcriptional regulator n=1 Tax=Schlesneria sp. DSM 10557 TaxID=3044399 RepID=UPI0035A0737A
MERRLLNAVFIMIALNDYTTDVAPLSSRHPSLHVIGGDATTRGYVLNQLSRVGLVAQEAATPAALLVHESEQELHRRRVYWADVEQRVAKLTTKDREVLDLLMECLPNKVLAMRLGITERAVEMRRASLMKKLEVRSLTELVRLVTRFAIVQQYGILLSIY